MSKINKKKNLFTLGLIAVIILGCLLAGEVSVRLYLLFSGKGGYIWIPDYYLGIVHAPDSKFTYKRGSGNEYSVNRRTNALGLVGGQIPIKKPQGTLRILILGDSFTEGLQVEEGKNFCERLEYLSNKDSPLPDKHFEVINAGVSGYSPIAEYLFLKRELIELEPDIIILQLFANDLFEDNKAGAMSVFDKNGLPVKNNRFFVKEYLDNPEPADEPSQAREFFYKINKYVVGKSVLLQCLSRATKQVYKHCRLHREKTSLAQYCDGNQFFILQEDNLLFKDVNFRNKAWSNSRKYILAIRDLARKNNARFFMFYIPLESQVESARYGENNNHFLNERLKELSAEENIVYLDLLPLFEENRARGLYYKEDGHLNNAGHELVAGSLLGSLNKYRFF